MKSEFVYGNFNDMPVTNPFEEIKQKRGNLIQTKNLKKLCNESKHFLHWVDYLRGVCSDKETARLLRNLPIFWLINDTNSSEIVIDGYNPTYKDSKWWNRSLSFGKITVLKSKNSENREKYIISVSYEDLVVPVIEINFYYWDNNSKIILNWIYCMIEFKWKPFRLESLTAWGFNPLDFLCWVLLSDLSESKDKPWFQFNLLQDTMDWFVSKCLSKFKLTRIDYRFDFFLPKWHFGLKDNEIFKNLRATNCNYNSSLYEARLNNCPYWVKTRYWRNYTWWKNYNKSKYMQTRFYQKQVDTRLKGWSELYPEYMNFDGEVWRLEFQFESKFCNARTRPEKRYNFFDEFKDKKLTNQVFEFVGVNEKKGSFFQRYEPVTLDLSKQPYSYQKRFLTRYINDTKKLLNNWINPMDLFRMNLNPEQKRKLKELDSTRRICNAFLFDVKIPNFKYDENWNLCLEN